jgi:site-specific recombinase XerC
MEQRGLAASTIDRRLSTVCGYYRFAHIDGRIAANPAQYVRRPRVQPTDQHTMDRGELGRFLFSAEHYNRSASVFAAYAQPQPPGGAPPESSPNSVSHEME